MVSETPIAPNVAPVAPVRTRRPRKCSKCHQTGHNKRQCPTRDDAEVDEARNEEVGGDFEDDIELEANIDEEADLQGVDVDDEEEVVNGFPEQTNLTDHHPLKWESRHTQEDGTIVDQRPSCKCCGKRTSYSCESCRVGLCLDAVGYTMSCWKNYHTA